MQENMILQESNHDSYTRPAISPGNKEIWKIKKYTSFLHSTEKEHLVIWSVSSLNFKFLLLSVTKKSGSLIKKNSLTDCTKKETID